jgi:hypothetical protein
MFRTRGGGLLWAASLAALTARQANGCGLRRAGHRQAIGPDPLSGSGRCLRVLYRQLTILSNPTKGYR